MSPRARPRLVVYWLSGCGGCETSILDLGDGLLELVSQFDLVAFPLLLDTKWSTLEGMPDRSIDLCLVSGALRSSHDLHTARTLRRISTYLVALGACAQLGSLLALADHRPGVPLLQAVYGGEAFASGSAEGHPPRPRVAVEGGVLELPSLTRAVCPLRAQVTVDFNVPGCPPEAARLAEVFDLLAGALVEGRKLPAQGAVLGATDAAVCEECARDRPTGPVHHFKRVHQATPDPTRCLLDQGLVCSGPATRGGCGALCPDAAMGCRGCYGPLAEVEDQGARMVGALAALTTGPDGERSRQPSIQSHPVPGDRVIDPIGTLYRYSFATSLLARLVPDDGENQ